MPGPELADHERIGQQVEVAAGGGGVHAQGTGRLRRVPDLPMVVGDHGPETQQRRRRNTHTPLRQVALEDRLDELFSPNHAVRLGPREEGPWDPSSTPELGGETRSEFGQGDPDPIQQGCSDDHDPGTAP